MDPKRDSRSQRIKNLQYKSQGRGRGRYLGPGHEVATDEAEGRTANEENETERVHTKRSGTSDRIGSNWDRYMEPDEADGAGTLDDGGVVEAKKQSEGLDYSLLLEEADALLRGGSISLLTHFDLDTEDLFQIHDVKEKPLPFNINLSVLNEGLLCLSMAERLGLEDELLCSQEEEEGVTNEALKADRGDKLWDAGAYSKQQPITAVSEAAEFVRKTVEPPGSVGAALSPMYRSPQGEAQVASRGTSWASEADVKAPGFRGRKDPTEEATSGGRQPEVSSSGRKQEEDTYLLDTILGDLAVKEGNGPTQESGSARPAAYEQALPEREEGGAAEQSGGKLVIRDLPAIGNGLLRRSGGGGGGSAQVEPLRGAKTDLPRSEAGRLGSLGGKTFRPADGAADSAASQNQREERASPAEDDIDALLAVLTPSTSNTQAYVTVDRAASDGGATGVMRLAVAGAGPVSAATPLERLPESGPLRSAKQLSRGLNSGSRPEQQGTPPVSARSKSTAPADQDFDAWLDSLS